MKRVTHVSDRKGASPSPNAANCSVYPALELTFFVHLDVLEPLYPHLFFLVLLDFVDESCGHENHSTNKKYLLLSEVCIKLNSSSTTDQPPVILMFVHLSLTRPSCPQRVWIGKVQFTQSPHLPWCFPVLYRGCALRPELSCPYLSHNDVPSHKAYTSRCRVKLLRICP